MPSAGTGAGAIEGRLQEDQQEAEEPREAKEHLSRRRLREIAPYATAVLLGLAGFFCFLLVFLETPFDRARPVPAEGVGMSPLLRHPSMMIHPPMLYSGYTLFAVPFAFAIGALVTRRVDVEWIRTVRPFALAAWLCLGVGVVLGARWSYSELGWGGYWAWDAVENAALMPWLTGTAFLHSVMVQEKRGMLKVWNMSLVLATGILAVLGTFLVRSGVLDSIHAFGASTLGIPFLILIATMIGGSIALVATRARYLRSEHRIDSLLSREVAFLLNNLVLVGVCFVIFWGTFFPLISEAATGTKASVGPPWFGRYITPLALVLVLLAGIGPVLSWRRSTASHLGRLLRVPVGAAATTLVVLLAASDVARKPAALVMFCVAAFVVVTMAQEVWRGVRARRAMSRDSVGRALVVLVSRNRRRRYGGYLVHVGVVVLFVGIAEQEDVRLEHQRPREPGALAHPARELVGHQVPSVAEAHLVEPAHDDVLDFSSALLGVLSERERDVVEYVHRAEQGAVLEQQAELLAHLEQLIVGHVRDRLPVHEDVALVGIEQADHVLDADRLPGSRRPEDHRHHPLGQAHVQSAQDPARPNAL